MNPFACRLRVGVSTNISMFLAFVRLLLAPGSQVYFVFVCICMCVACQLLLTPVRQLLQAMRARMAAGEGEDDEDDDEKDRGASK